MPRSVQLSDDAYATLASLKASHESFSDVVKRLAAGRKDPLALLRLQPVREGFDVAALRAQSAEQERARWAARG